MQLAKHIDEMEPNQPNSEFNPNTSTNSIDYPYPTASVASPKLLSTRNSGARVVPGTCV